MDNLSLKVGNIVAKGEIAPFFFCHYVFKKLSAAEASESVYMRERVKSHFVLLIPYLTDVVGTQTTCIHSPTDKHNIFNKLPSVQGYQTAILIIYLSLSLALWHVSLF